MAFTNTNGSRVPVTVPKPKKTKAPPTPHYSGILRRPTPDQVDRQAVARKAQLKTSFHQGGDIKGDAETAKAETFKHSNQFVRDMFAAVKAHYDQASPAEKKRIFGNPSEDAKNPATLRKFKTNEASLAAAGVLTDVPGKIYEKGAIHPALKALELLGRPQHTVAGAADAAVNHKNLGHELGANLSGKEHTGFSDVMAHAHVLDSHKTTRAILGFGGDLVSDPLNYITLGAASPAEIAARQATRGALREAPEDLARAGAEAAKASAGKATNKGFHVGFRVPLTGREFSTSGKTTAFISRHSGAHKVAEGARAAGGKTAALIDKTVGHVAPDLRKASRGEGVADLANRREQERLLRADTHRVSQRAAHEREALQKQGADAEDLKHIERAPIETPDLTYENKVKTERATAKQEEGRLKRKKASVEKRRERALGRAEFEVPQGNRKALKELHVHLTGHEPAGFHTPDEIKAEINTKLAEAAGKAGPEGETARAFLNYRKATSARIRAGYDKTAAAKGERNATLEGTGEETVADLHGVPGKERPHATDLYSDNARTVKENALQRADERLQTAKANHEAATRILEETAEKHAGLVASGNAKKARSAGPLKSLGRSGKSNLLKLDKYEAQLGELDARIAKQKATQETFKGQPKTESRILTASGEHYTRDVRPNLERHEPETDLQNWVRHRNQEMNRADIASGALDPKQVVEDYTHHAEPHELEAGENGPASDRQSLFRGRKKGAGAANHTKTRKLDVSVHEANTKLGTSFSTDVGAVHGHRVLIGGQRNARIEYGKNIVKGHPKYTGQPFAKDYEGVYELNPKTGQLAAVDKHALDEADKTSKFNENWHVMNKANANEAIDRYTRVAKPSNFFQKFIAAPWKSAVTQFNPSYHVGNEIGNRLMAWQADTTVKAWNESHRMVRLLAKRNRWEKSAASLKPGAKFEDTLTGKGLRNGMSDKELWGTVAEAEKQGALSSGVASHELQFLTGKNPGRVRKFGERRENQPRLATYLSARQGGMTPTEAANWTNKHHIDYGDLTPAERKLRDIGIPFYTFTARNTRLQVEKLLTRPNKAANFELTREDVNKQADQDPGFEKVLKRYQQAGMPFVLKIGGLSLLLTPRTPIDQGLSRALGNPGDWLNTIGSAIGAPYKAPFELGYNYNSFRREHIEDPDKDQGQVPAPAWMAKAIDMLGLGKLARVQKKDDGTYEWRANTDYIINLVPAGKAIKDTTLPKDKTNAFQQTPAESAASAFGFKLSGLDPNANAYGKSVDTWKKADSAVKTYDRLHASSRGDKPYYIDPVTKTRYEFNSATRSKLVKDRSVKLKAMELLKPKTGPKTVLETRPLPPDQAIQQKIKKRLDAAKDPGAAIREREREMKRRIAQLGIK